MRKIPRISFLKTQKIKLEFEILTLSNLFSRQAKLGFSLAKPHRLDFYHILFITKGTGVHYVDFLPYSYRTGSILFISKGQVHAFELGSDRDGFLLLFTEAFLSKNLIHSDILSFYRLYNYHLNAPILQPEETGQENFLNILSEIHKEYHSADGFA